MIKNSNRGVSVFVFMVIIAVLILVVSAGIFVYENIQNKNTDLNRVTDFISSNEGFKLNWFKNDDISEHIGSKKAEFIISRSGLSPTTKTIVWPVLKNISDQQIVSKINKILDFNTNIKNFYGDTFGQYDANNLNGITGVVFKVNYDKNGLLSLNYTINTYGAYPDEISFNQNINTKTGNLVDITELTSKSKTSILSLLNQKLKVIKDNAEQETKDTADDLLSSAVFTDKNLNEFSITENGLEYNFDFGFPHSIQELEPNGLVKITWAELNQ